MENERQHKTISNLCRDMAQQAITFAGKSIKTHNMTLKELFDSVPFDSLLPYLKEHEPEHLDAMYDYREAYDLLRAMTPNRDYEGEARVEWSGWDDEKKWLGVHHLDGDAWEDALAKEIVIAEDVQIPIEKIAMLCLWEITFYGFSPEQIHETFNNMVNHKKPATKYEIALHKLEESIWKHETPRRLRSKGPNGELYTPHDDAHFDKITSNRMNRSKRKRKYRQEKRIKFLESMIAREKIIAGLTGKGSSFTSKDLEFLFRVNCGHRYDYASVTTCLADRLPYIIESMTRYQELDLSQYNQAVVAIHVSSRYPLEEEETEHFRQLVRSRLGYSDIKFGTILHDNDRKEISVTLLLNNITN